MTTGDAPPAPRRLLVIEDNVGHARFLRQVIELLPFEAECHQAGRVAAGVDRLAAEHFDAVVTDLYLPDGQGAAVVRRLLEVDPALAVIVVSAVDDEEVAREVLALGAGDFITKERLTPELLGHCLRRAEQLVGRDRTARVAAGVEPSRGLYAANALLVGTRRALAFARRKKHPVTIVHLRVPAAAAELGELAAMLVSVVRDADMVGRTGPGRFCLVLPDDQSNPPAVLNRIQARREGTPVARIPIEVEVRRYDPGSPVSAEELLEPPAAPATADEARPQRRALLVTADSELPAAVQTGLGDDWSVLVAANAAQAVRLVVLEDPELLVLDLDLPAPGPMAVLRQIGEQPEAVSLVAVGIDPIGGVGSEHSDYREGLHARVARPSVATGLGPAVDWAVRHKR